jgi:tetratricopeptide (TPR) repeat protein
MNLNELARRIKAGDKGELSEFKRLLAVENDLEALKQFADAHWQEDEISVPIYERFLEINPENDQALGSLGLVKYFIGEDVEAAQYLEKARKINPEGIEVLTLQAALEKRPDEKLRIYKKILELDPTNQVALHNLARSQPPGQ